MSPVVMQLAGQLLDLRALRPEQLDMEHVATSLARQVRFNGWTLRPYSVAEHSVRCSWLADPEHRLAALLHDASEAFVGDIPTPVKRLAPEIEALEHSIMGVIEARFRLAPGALTHSDVKAVDALALRAEAHALTREPSWCQPAPARVHRHFLELGWSEARARREFLERLRGLT